MSQNYKQNVLTQDKWLTELEVKKLLKQPDKRYLLGMRDFAILKIFLNCGLRKAELINLDVKDYHKEGISTWLSVHSKGGYVMDQPINDFSTNSAIKKYLKSGKHGDDPNAPLFQSLQGKGILSGQRTHRIVIEYLTNKYAIQAGIKKHVHAHMLRHTFGTHFFNATKDLVTTQKAMRHKSGNSTMIYLHSDKTQVLKGLKELNL